MPYDGNGNFTETCGDMCISNRFAKDSGNAAAVESVPQVLCGFACGGYGDPDRGGMCARCIIERGMEDVFPSPAAASRSAESKIAPTQRQSDLMELVALDPSIVLDIKYARTDNFMGRVLYPDGARALLQRPEAQALVRVQAALASVGLGLIVFDAYRPASVTQQMWDETAEPLRIFVANPATGSKHNRGCAVDVTLCKRGTDVALRMPSEFDEFTERAFADFDGCSDEERANRSTLRDAMAKEGFAINPKEWWHYDHCTWEQYPLLDVPFPPSM